MSVEKLKFLYETNNKISNEKIKKAIENFCEDITNIDSLESKLNKLYGNQSSKLSYYSEICMFIGECADVLPKKYEWKKIAFAYLIKIRDLLYKKHICSMTSLFGGYVNIGFGIFEIYKKFAIGKKMLDTINDIIVNAVNKVLGEYFFSSKMNNVRMQEYDLIFGLSGTAGYLLFFCDNYKIKVCVENILRYLIELVRDKEVLGFKVPGWYIRADNQFLQSEKELYSNGNFNMGLSHGIAGPLTSLSLALNSKVEIKGQKEAIKKILDIYKSFKYDIENNNIYWPDRIKFEDYINNNIGKKVVRRNSWCYGTPGIARAMYIAGKAIKDEEAVNIATKALKGLSNSKYRDYGIISPTICHGYSGLLIITNVMYKDTLDSQYLESINGIINKIIDFYDEKSIFGFYNIEPNIDGDNKIRLLREDNIVFLEGAIGIYITLMTLGKEKCLWLRHLLIE